jgi:hypothetical protein
MPKQLFQPGNKMALRRTHRVTGRKKGLVKQISDEIEKNPHRIGEALETLYQLGIKGDKDCLMYYLDRVWGKPKGITELKGMLVSGTPEDYKKAAELMTLDKIAELALLAPIEPDNNVDNSNCKVDNDNLSLST